MDVGSAEARSNPITASVPRERIRRAPPRRMSLLLIANPNASGVHGSSEIVGRATSLLRSFGARVETRWTSAPEELAALVSEEERRVVLLGGDGTLHAVANVGGHKPELALLPRGRANNVARALGIPLDLDSATRLAIAGVASPVDAIGVRSPGLELRALEGVSVGFHAQARARYRGANSADTIAGVASALAAFTRFEPISVTLDLDGEIGTRRLGQLFVVNFPFFGPRLPVAPAADPGDGRLEVVEIDAGGRLELAAALARVKRGTHLGRTGVRLRTARRVRIATSERSPIVADTTVIASGPVELTVRPRTIALVGGLQ